MRIAKVVLRSFQWQRLTLPQETSKSSKSQVYILNNYLNYSEKEQSSNQKRKEIIKIRTGIKKTETKNNQKKNWTQDLILRKEKISL